MILALFGWNVKMIIELQHIYQMENLIKSQRGVEKIKRIFQNPDLFPFSTIIDKISKEMVEISCLEKKSRFILIKS